eukprot:TRINITY_DN5301_c0_g1_i4.p1 TRINITY_DN5301_c0_g1~~TRINITY_DN5301_c0_g1_i4.p1  ORF type:complete len:116 (-),score=14.06 TRINITY_DN5301_c0_g1_i4:64-411(-)
MAFTSARMPTGPGGGFSLAFSINVKNWWNSEHEFDEKPSALWTTARAKLCKVLVLSHQLFLQFVMCHVALTHGLPTALVLKCLYEAELYGLQVGFLSVQGAVDLLKRVFHFFINN